MMNNSAPPARPDRALVVVLAAVAGLVLVALAAILLRGAPKELEPASPEGVVQRYSTAVIAGDTAAALALLSERLSTDCDPLPFYSDPTGTRVTMLSADRRDESATVSVMIRISYGSGPFDSGQSESRQAFELVKEQDRWKIDEAPYELALCDWWDK